MEIVFRHSSAEFVRRCVNSIREQATGFTYEILVVDNASFDGCDKVSQKHAPDAMYIQCDKNLGFAEGEQSGVSGFARYESLFTKV